MGSRHSRAGLSRHSRGSLLSFPRVSPAIPAQVSPAIPAQVSPAIPAGLPRHSRTGLPRHSRTGFSRHSRTGFSRHSRTGLSRHSRTGFSRHSRGSLPPFPHRSLPPFSRVSPVIPAQAGIHTGAQVMKQPVLCIMASNLKNRRWEPRTWLSGNSDKQFNKRREWKSPGCWARSALLTILASYLMDSRLRGNDEENQSPGHHGFPRRCELHIIASYFEGLQRRAG